MLLLLAWFPWFDFYKKASKRPRSHPERDRMADRKRQTILDIKEAFLSICIKVTIKRIQPPQAA